jgi:PAS domain-containing protein
MRLTSRESAEAGPVEQSPGELPCDWLFNAAAEPILIVDVATATIVTANAPGAALFRTTIDALVGSKLSSVFEAPGAAKIERSMMNARATGTSDAGLRIRNTRVDLRARLSLFRAPPKAYLLVHLIASGTYGIDRASPVSTVFEAIDGAPVGFLITDPGLCIDYANRLFGEMISLGGHARLYGSSVVRWLRFNESDLARLRMQVSDRQAALNFTTELCSARGSSRPVAVCAVAVPDDPEPCWGFTVRELPRMN